MGETADEIKRLKNLLKTPEYQQCMHNVTAASHTIYHASISSVSVSRSLTSSDFSQTTINALFDEHDERDEEYITITSEQASPISAHSLSPEVAAMSELGIYSKKVTAEYNVTPEVAG